MKRKRLLDFVKLNTLFYVYRSECKNDRIPWKARKTLGSEKIKRKLHGNINENIQEEEFAGLKKRTCFKLQVSHDKVRNAMDTKEM